MLQYWRVFLLIFALMGVGAYQLYGIFSNVGYKPEQPVKYSHVLHAGVMGMECLYCHSSAEKSAHAGIPSADVCMGCHSIVQTQSPEIQKLAAYYEEGKAVPWVRIHDLPDHAYFNHKWHVQAGVSCQTCHGEIQNMEVVGQVNKLEMAACMECHRQSNYIENIDHPATFLDPILAGAHGDLEAASAEAESILGDYQGLEEGTLTDPSEDDYWVSLEFSKYADVENMSPDRVAASLSKLKEYQDNLYVHGRTAQLRGANASVECSTCHY